MLPVDSLTQMANESVGNNLYALIPIVVKFRGAHAIGSTGATQRKQTTGSTKAMRRRKEDDIPK